MDKKIFKIFIYFSLIIFVVFVYVFFITKDIINIPSPRFLHYMNRGKKYWFYYLDLKQDESFINSIYCIKYIFDVILIGEFFFISLNEKFKKFVEIKEILFSLAVMIILYYIQKFIVYNYIYNNKLYMIFYPTLIASICILFLSIRILKRINKE